MKLWIFVLSLVPIVFGSSDERPVIDSPSGKYRGHILKTRNGRDIFAFQGIPYTLPPVGPLRLKDPVKMPKLEGIFDADKDLPMCFQPSLDFSQSRNISSYVGTEDCLYLNVYKPKIKDEGKLLPVLVWIHGGAFVLGSGSFMWGNPTYLLDRDMIFVAMNYRLGMLGFLSTGDQVVPGNFGMKDQVMALKWVQENIKAFGGDPDLVTINGLSAGGAAVSLLMHSPLSAGLFHRVIAQSGNAHCPFSTKSENEAVFETEKVASYLGCSKNSKQMLKCFQKMPINELFKASVLPIVPWFAGLSMNFVPVIEEESEEPFLTQESFDKPSDIPLIVSVTSQEMIHSITGLLFSTSKYQGNKTLLLDNLDDFIEEAIAFWGSYRGHPREKEITDAIIKFYFGNNGVKDATEIKIIELFSDLLFNHAMRITARKENGPTYVYKFSYKGALSFPGEVQVEDGLEDGVGHGSEILYLTNVTGDQAFTKEDLDMSNQMIDVWYNFMKTGDPTPESNLWKESAGGVHYLDFTNEGLHMKSNMFQPRMDFMDTLNIDRKLIRHEEL